MKREPDVDRFLLNQLEVAVRLGVQHRTTAPARRPEKRLLLQPIKLHTEARPIRRTVRERAVKRALLRARRIRIRVEVIRILDAFTELRFEVLSQLQVIKTIGALQALPDFEQVSAIDEPSSVCGHCNRTLAPKRVGRSSRDELVDDHPAA